MTKKLTERDRLIMKDEIDDIEIKGPDDEKRIKRSLKKKSKLLARCYKAGMSKAQLARAFSVTDVTILYWLRKEGVQKDKSYTVKRRENKDQDVINNFCCDNIDGDRDGILP